MKLKFGECRIMFNIFHKILAGNGARETGKPGAGAEEYRKRLGLLCDDAQKASTVSEISKLFEEIVRMTQQMIQASAASLLLIDEGKGELYFQAAVGQVGNKLGKMRISLDSGIAGWVARNGKPLVINDVTRDKRFSEELDKATGFTTKSVMAVPVLRGKKVIGVLEAINKADGHGFTEPDLAALKEFVATQAMILIVSMVATATNNIEQHQLLIDWYRSTFETLITAADAKDPYAYGHSRRVMKYAMMAAGSLPLSREELQAIEFGALLHDIGKIDIHDVVLRKSGPLTDAEWHIMRKHALRGANIVSGIPFLEKVKDIVLYHHERYDGKGYPYGLKGKSIPVGARLVAVAEAFDSMTTAHSYRVKMGIDEAIGELVEGIGTQFCPVAVEAFVSAFKKSQGQPAKTEDEGPAVKKTGGDGAGLPEARDAETGADAASPETCEGGVQLAVVAPDGLAQVKLFKEYLEKVDGLNIISDSWSEAEGTIIYVSLQKPVALTSILNTMPVVEKVAKKHRNLVVMLKTPAASNVFKDGFSLV